LPNSQITVTASDSPTVDVTAFKRDLNLISRRGMNDPKSYLLQSLANFSNSHPGKVEFIIQQSLPDEKDMCARLINYLQIPRLASIELPSI
jgi:hypothetical protein